MANKHEEPPINPAPEEARVRNSNLSEVCISKLSKNKELSAYKFGNTFSTSSPHWGEIWRAKLTHETSAGTVDTVNVVCWIDKDKMLRISIGLEGDN